jgi:hypothetical protein
MLLTDNKHLTQARERSQIHSQKSLSPCLHNSEKSKVLLREMLLKHFVKHQLQNLNITNNLQVMGSKLFIKTLIFTAALRRWLQTWNLHSIIRQFVLDHSLLQFLSPQFASHDSPSKLHQLCLLF